MIVVNGWREHGVEYVALSEHLYWVIFECPDGRTLLEVSEDQDSFLQSFLLRSMEPEDYPVVLASDEASLLMSRCSLCGDPIVGGGVVVDAYGVHHARCEGGV